VPVVVVLAMIVMVPVAFMHLPALLVVVIMRMIPVAALIGWALPGTCPPYIASAIISPIALLPNIALARHGGPNFAAKRRWSAADVDPDLPDCWCGKCGKR
jgi:hypothetical protein